MIVMMMAQAKAVGEGEEAGWDLQRFTPLLQDLLEDVAAGSLKQDEFPYVNPPADTGSLPAGIFADQLHSTYINLPGSHYLISIVNSCFLVRELVPLLVSAHLFRLRISGTVV